MGIGCAMEGLALVGIVLSWRALLTRGSRATPQCCVGAALKLEACQVPGLNGDYTGINGAGWVPERWSVDTGDGA
jgi:hypothetical protein